MKPNVDRRIAELLCSRICHELVAGIAAINNGVELISEIDASMFDEAMGLIGACAEAYRSSRDPFWLKSAPEDYRSALIGLSTQPGEPSVGRPTTAEQPLTAPLRD